MSFKDFTFPQVQQVLGLEVNEADLFSGAAVLPLRDEFVAMIREGATLALSTNTEKAKSEFIIAPILFELRRIGHGNFGLFSGVELDVDAARGLNGICDFILTKVPKQIVLSAPIVAIVEAKNDNIRSGLGQCIASMYAALLFNQEEHTPITTVYGVVTTGSTWRFLQLQSNILTVDTQEYYIDGLGKIMGILQCLVQQA